MNAVATASDGVFCCPSFDSTYVKNKINCLRRHCKRSHGISISVKRARVSADMKRTTQRIYSARYRAKMKTRTTLRQREVFTSDDADVFGGHGHPSCPVEYRQSSIPSASNGIFARVDLAPGDIVTWYGGRYTKEEPTKKTYAIATGSGFIDGITEPRDGEGLANFVNRETRSLSKKRKNCELISGRGSKHGIYVEVTKKVKAGSELLTTYSHGYRSS